MKFNATSLYRSAADRRQQSQKCEQGHPAHQVGSRLGPHSSHCTYRSATGYIWVTAWLPASGMTLILRSTPTEMLLVVFMTRPQCCCVCGSPYEHCANGNGSGFGSRLFFSNVSFGTISDSNLTGRKLLSHENLTVRPLSHMWNSRSNHYCLRCEPHCPTIPVSDLNLTPASLCASGRRAGYQLRQRTATERRQRGGSQQQGANGSGQASVGICGRQQCHLSSELSQVALWIRQRS